jgi:hypothetical protein
VKFSIVASSIGIEIAPELEATQLGAAKPPVAVIVKGSQGP